MDLKQIASFVKIEHTLFSLPFVFIGALMAGEPTYLEYFWILIAAVGARGLVKGRSSYLFLTSLRTLLHILQS